jgi:hypothetical protein
MQSADEKRWDLPPEPNAPARVLTAREKVGEGLARVSVMLCGLGIAVGSVQTFTAPRYDRFVVAHDGKPTLGFGLLFSIIGIAVCMSLIGYVLALKRRVAFVGFWICFVVVVLLIFAVPWSVTVS